MNVNVETYAVALEAGVQAVVVDVSETPAARDDGRVTHEIYNNGSSVVYLGGSDVSASSGIPLPVGSSRTIAVRFQGKVYAVCAGAGDLRVMVVP